MIADGPAQVTGSKNCTARRGPLVHVSGLEVPVGVFLLVDIVASTSPWRRPPSQHVRRRNRRLAASPACRPNGRPNASHSSLVERIKVSPVSSLPPTAQPIRGLGKTSPKTQSWRSLQVTLKGRSAGRANRSAAALAMERQMIRMQQAPPPDEYASASPL